MLLGDSVRARRLSPCLPPGACRPAARRLPPGAAQQAPHCRPCPAPQGVGKSCIVLRYVRGTFDPSSKITVGAAFLAHNVALPGGASLKFEIW